MRLGKTSLPLAESDEFRDVPCYARYRENTLRSVRMVVGGAVIEDIASYIIAFGSLLLFVSWFRYACLLVLRAKPPRDYAAAAAAANQLGFPEVQVILRDRADSDLEELKRLLDRDFALLTYVLRHASPPARIAAIEKRMLEIDYRLMRAWYHASSNFSRTAAHRALDEMSIVVAHFASSVGERLVGLPALT
jgi:hypothetical protein